MLKVRTVCLLVAVIGSLVCSSSAGPTRYGRDRVVKWSPRQNGCPVKVTNLQVRGNSVRFGEPFLEDNDWLQQLSFDVTNSSQKTITMLYILGTVPTSPRPIQLPLEQFGSRTDFYGVAPTNWLKPQETIPVTFPAGYIAKHPEIPDEIKSGLADPSEVTVRVTVVFEDDTMWDFGQTMVRSKDLKGWVPASSSVRSSSEN